MRKLLLFLVILAAIALAADRIGARVAEGELERRAAEQAGVPVRADIRGFPFLTQALSRRLDHVTLEADRYRLPQGLDVTGLTADVHEVDVTDPRVPIAGRVRLEGTLPFAEVERRLQLRGGSLRAGGPDSVVVSQRLNVAGQLVAASAQARTRVERGVLLVEPTDVTVSGITLDPRLEAQVIRRLALRYPIPGLPFGAQVSGLGTTAEGFRVGIVATRVELVL
jgi:hypothetical protein